jgi:hypothetical protein
MRYLSEGGFNIAGTKNGTTSEAYREGWERTFGKKNGPDSPEIAIEQAKCSHKHHTVTKYCEDCDIVVSIEEVDES